MCSVFFLLVVDYVDTVHQISNMPSEKRERRQERDKVMSSG